MNSLSIVLYCTKQEDVDNLQKGILSLEGSLKTFIVDNSPTSSLATSFSSLPQVDYIHNPSNPGFGASHNVAFVKAIEEGGDYHFVVNPDAIFTKEVIVEMIAYLEENKEIGMMMPQILNLDGSVQHLPKLLPSPFSILLRKLKRPKFIYNSFIDRYELRNVAPYKIYQAPILSGCFTAFRLSAVKEVGMYDDKFFMYFEDWDLSRRMNEKYKTIYFPKVAIFHGYESGANKSRKLFGIFLKSCVYYFNKWGWFFDRKRKDVNAKTLSQFQ